MKPTKEPKTDGRGQPIVADALYYVQDTRQVVGNCILWWAKDGAGYCCNLPDAGEYTGVRCARLRHTDVPWPVDYVRAHTVVHVRGDVAAFSLVDYKAGPER